MSSVAPKIDPQDSQTHKPPSTLTPPHRYLFTEFEDPEFGGRASAVHGAMLSALDGAGPAGKAVCNAIRKQTEVMSQLAYISKELKVGWGHVGSSAVAVLLTRAVFCADVPRRPASARRDTPADCACSLCCRCLV